MANVESNVGGFLGHAGQMLDTHPGQPVTDRKELLACIEACFDCAQACIACADACLGEKELDALRRCIRLNQDCASVCSATGNVLSRQTAYEPRLGNALLKACMTACQLCAEECNKHAKMHEHCRVCAEACQRCEQACSRMLAS